MAPSLRKFFLLSLVHVLAACSGSSAEVPGEGDEEPRQAYVRFQAQDESEPLSGILELRLETNLEGGVGKLVLQVDGETAAEFAGLPMAMMLDSSAFPNGTRSVRLEALSDDGAVYTDTIEVDFENPEQRLESSHLSQQAYGRGEEIIMELGYDRDGLRLSADFGELDSEFQPSQVRTQDLGDGRYELRYRISAENTRAPRQYLVTVLAAGATGQPLESRLLVHFAGDPKLPLVVEAAGASFFLAPPMKIELASGAPQVQSLELPGRLVQGKEETLTVTWTAPEENPAESILITGPSNSGAWVVPLGTPSTSGSLQIPLDLGGVVETIGAGVLPTEVSVLGSDGTTAGSQQGEIETILMPPVGVKVLLDWTGSADLDLGLTTPDGSRIDYISPSAQGGQFEKDSNSMCRPSPLPFESIAWAPGAELAGDYVVDVTQYDNCSQGDVSYEITVLACGQASTLSGSFAAGDVGSSARQILPAFAVACLQRLSGRVEFVQDSMLGPSEAPARHVPLRVLGTGAAAPPSTETDDEGRYDVYFASPPGAELSVEVEASWTPPGSMAPRARVVGLAGSEVYRSSFEIGVLTSDSVQQDLILRRDQFAGAFNILDVMQQAFAWIDTAFDTETRYKVAPLLARWQPFTDTPDPMGSYYWCAAKEACSAEHRNPMAIWITGRPDNPDEFDDSVIAHEFMHHFARSLGIDNSPGGTHYFNSRVAPAFAWSEGLATGLGQHVLRNPLFLSGRDKAWAWVDLETTLGDATEGMAFGTDSANSVTGNLNEFLVSAILWDLLDPANEIPQDPIDTSLYATYLSLANYLPSTDWVDRGALGRDLVDFLDGWRCFSKSNADALAQAATETSIALLVGQRQFLYAAPSPEPRCRRSGGW